MSSSQTGAQGGLGASRVSAVRPVTIVVTISTVWVQSTRRIGITSLNDLSEGGRVAVTTFKRCLRSRDCFTGTIRVHLQAENSKLLVLEATWFTCVKKGSF